MKITRLAAPFKSNKISEVLCLHESTYSVSPLVGPDLWLLLFKILNKPGIDVANTEFKDLWLFYVQGLSSAAPGLNPSLWGQCIWWNSQ